MTPEEKKAFDDLQAEKAEVEQKLKAAEAENRKIRVKAKLSAAGFKEGEDGKFEGLSEATMTVLLSADPEAAAAMIADLKPKASADLPKVLLSDTPAAEQEAEGKFSISTVKGKNYV